MVIGRGLIIGVKLKAAKKITYLTIIYWIMNGTIAF